MKNAKQLFRLFWFILSVGIPGTQLFSQTLSDGSLERVKKSSVFISVKHQFVLTSEEISTSGSGFFINDKGRIATNYHVIQSSLSDRSTVYPTRIKEIKVICNSGTSDYKKYNAIVVSIDKENDLAILAVSDSVKFPFVEIDTSKLSELKPVWTFGYPFGEEFTVLQRGPEITVSKGSISALRHDDLSALNRIQVDAVINHGNSGGPVVNEQGRMVGVINSMMGSSRINFAVPAHYLVKMNMELPADFSAKGTTRVKIRTVPGDAEVFIDGVKQVWSQGGEKEFEAANGLHTLAVMKKGFNSCLKEVTFNGNYSDTIQLVADKTFLIPGGTGRDVKPGPSTASVINSEEVLMRENFDDTKKFEKWEQNTGGEKTRTWYLEDGVLHQFENNGILHAIYLGDKKWDNYTVKAKVKISGENGQQNADSRAGIIFRETEQGFYLLRIHKESNKAQLAYHFNNPFGWFIITEKKVDIDITEGTWYDLSASMHGNMISCFLNGVQLFTVNASYSSEGRVGFYSVESKPVFDSLSVVRASSVDHDNSAEKPSLVSFWFSDHFDLKSNWWYQYRAKDGAEEINPVYMVNGSFAITDMESGSQSMELTKYALGDFSLDLAASVDTGNADAMFEVFLRKEGLDRLAVRFQKKDNRIMVLQYEGGKEKVLKDKKFSFNIFGSNASIRITSIGNSVLVGSVYSEWISVDGKGIRTNPGRIGFTSRGVRLAFHQMTLSSVPPKTK